MGPCYTTGPGQQTRARMRMRSRVRACERERPMGQEQDRFTRAGLCPYAPRGGHRAAHQAPAPVDLLFSRSFGKLSKRLEHVFATRVKFLMNQGVRCCFWPAACPAITAYPCRDHRISVPRSPHIRAAITAYHSKFTPPSVPRSPHITRNSHHHPSRDHRTSSESHPTPCLAGSIPARRGEAAARPVDEFAVRRVRRIGVAAAALEDSPRASIPPLLGVLGSA